MGAGDVTALPRRRSEELQRFLLEHDHKGLLKDDHHHPQTQVVNGGSYAASSPRLWRGRIQAEIAPTSRYQLGTISSNAQRRFPASPFTVLPHSLIPSPNREKSPDAAALTEVNGTSSSSSTPSAASFAPADSKRRPLPSSPPPRSSISSLSSSVSSGDQNKHTSSNVKPDAGSKPRDRRRIPARSFDAGPLGLWPSTSGTSLSSVRHGDSGDNRLKQDNDNVNVQDVTSRRPSGDDACDHPHENGGRDAVTPRRLSLDPSTEKKVSTDAKAKLERKGRTAAREKASQDDDSCVRPARHESPDENLHQRRAAPLGKQLGDHFENLDSKLVRQLIRQSDGKKKAIKKKSESDGNIPAANGEAAAEEAGSFESTSKSGISLSRTSSVRKESPETEKRRSEVNSNGGGKPDAQRWSGFSHTASSGKKKSESKKSSGSSTASSLTRAMASLLGQSRIYRSGSGGDGGERKKGGGGKGEDAKVERSLSMDHGRRPGKGGGGGERGYRSFEGLDMAESSSDTESSASSGVGQTAANMWRRGRGGGGDEVAGTASASGRRLRVAAWAVASPDLALPRPRRDAALDLSLLLNRCLQWRFVNAASSAAMDAQTKTALISLYNACISTFKLRTSMTTQQVVVNKAKHDYKLDSILETLGESLNKWNEQQVEHSYALNSLIQALEATIVRVPLVGGVKANTQSMKDALGFAISTMKALDYSTRKSLPHLEEVDVLLSNLAEIVILERSLLEELHELTSIATTLEVEERSLRAYFVQIEQERCHIHDSGKSFTP